ncbi:hypothetical protein H7X64_00460 [Armatimonadetes bacterium]|nr:hypothetical protein [bacterium]
MINAYNDAMYLVGDPSLIPFLIAGTFIVLLLVILALFRLVQSFLRKQFIESLDEFFIYAVLGLFSFVLFKNGFVRGDGHNYYFFRGILFVAALLYLFIPKGAHKKLVLAYCWIVLAISLWAMNSLPGSFKPVTRIVTLSIIPIKYGEIKKYFSDVSNYTIDGPNVIQNDQLKNAVGDLSIDIVPAEISEVYFHRLNYNPRPVIQSYSAYNGFLDSLNNIKLNSANKPDYLLFSLSSIDDRYPFFDEGRTKLAILGNYHIKTFLKNQLLLEKNTLAKPIIVKERVVKKFKLGEEISIPTTTTLQFSKFQINYTLWGKIKRLFFRPPQLSITFTLENGDSYTYRAVTTIISGGVIINKYIDTNEEFNLLMRTNGLLNTNVKKIRLAPVDGEKGFDGQALLVTSHYQIGEDSLNTITAEDSVQVLELFKKYQPSDFKSPLHYNDSIRITLESVNRHSAFVKIGGWAFATDKDNSVTTTTILLRSIENEYELLTEQTPRPDLQDYFRRKDLGQSGFSATVTKSSLTPGIYQIGVRIKKDKEFESVYYSDHEVVIPTMARIDSITHLPPGKNAENLLHTIELVENGDTDVSIRGWAAIKNENSSSSNTNILLMSSTRTYRISTQKGRRQDVADHFKDPKLLLSGFSTIFSNDNIVKDSYTIAIEEFTANNEKLISVTDKTINIKTIAFFIPRKAEMPVVEDFNGRIENLKEEDDHYAVSGWAVPAKSDFAGYSIKIVLKSDSNVFIADTESQIRKDVTDYFKNGFNYDGSGFFTRIDKKTLPEGKYQVGILLSKEGKEEKVKLLNEYITK